MWRTCAGGRPDALIFLSALSVGNRLQAVTGLSGEDAVRATQLLPEVVPVKRLLRALKIAAAADAGEEKAIPAGGPPMAITLPGLEAHLQALQKVATNQRRLQMGVGYERMNNSAYN